MTRLTIDNYCNMDMTRVHTYLSRGYVQAPPQPTIRKGTEESALFVGSHGTWGTVGYYVSTSMYHLLSINMDIYDNDGL